jgi:hypothetical protein
MARKLLSRDVLPAHSVVDSHARTALLVKFKYCQGKKIARRALPGNIKTIRGVRCAKIANKDTLNHRQLQRDAKSVRQGAILDKKMPLAVMRVQKGRRPLLAENTVKFVVQALLLIMQPQNASFALFTLFQKEQPI